MLTTSLLPAKTTQRPLAPGPVSFALNVVKVSAETSKNTPPPSSHSRRRPGGSLPPLVPPTPPYLKVSSRQALGSPPTMRRSPRLLRKRSRDPLEHPGTGGRPEIGATQKLPGRQERLGQLPPCKRPAPPPCPPEGRGAACPMPLPNQLWVRKLAQLRPKRGPSGGGSSSHIGRTIPPGA